MLQDPGASLAFWDSNAQRLVDGNRSIGAHFVGQRGLSYHLFLDGTESSGGRLEGKFLTFTEKRTERSSKLAARTFRRMQENFLTYAVWFSLNTFNP